LPVLEPLYLYLPTKVQNQRAEACLLRVNSCNSWAKKGDKKAKRKMIAEDIKEAINLILAAKTFTMR
jgi:hypothetical protein